MKVKKRDKVNILLLRTVTPEKINNALFTFNLSAVAVHEFNR